MEGIYANQVHPVNGSEINENAHFQMVSSVEFQPVRLRKSLNSHRERDTKEVLTHFDWLYLKYQLFSGQIELCSVWQLYMF